MKKLQKLSLVLLSTLFIFSSCSKEEALINTDDAIEQGISAEGLTVDITEPQEYKPRESFEIKILEYGCFFEDQFLTVFLERPNGTLDNVSPDKFTIEWLDHQRHSISKEDFTPCIGAGNYQVTVKLNNSSETRTMQYLIKGDDDSDDGDS